MIHIIKTSVIGPFVQAREHVWHLSLGGCSLRSIKIGVDFINYYLDDFFSPLLLLLVEQLRSVIPTVHRSIHLTAEEGVLVAKWLTTHMWVEFTYEGQVLFEPPPISVDKFADVRCRSTAPHCLEKCRALSCQYLREWFSRLFWQHVHQ